MAKSTKKSSKITRDDDETLPKHAQQNQEDLDQSYKLNHLFQNVNPLTLLNLATEHSNNTNAATKKSLYDLDREGYGRTNYYFTITSPDYLRQLFESEDDDNDNDDYVSEEEKLEQTETCLGFISNIERFIAQLALDRMPWEKNPLQNRDPKAHIHCLKNVDFKREIPFCRQGTEQARGGNGSVDEFDGASLLHQLRKKKSECDKLDLQVFFRDMFATKELIKEQDIAKNKNLKKQSIVPFDTNDEKDQFEDGFDGAKNVSETARQSNTSGVFKSSATRKSEFLNEWSAMSKEKRFHFLENYSLLSILVKEGGLSYKVTNQATNSQVGPNYTTNKDLKKNYKVIERKLTGTYKTLDGFMDFPKYVYNSKETFFGKYLLNSNPQELDWDIPQLLDMSFFVNSLITERNLLYSTVWANFMEGLINHYMENEIIPAVERDVCFQLLQPSLKLLYYLKRYDQGNSSPDKGLLPKVFEPCLKELDDLYMSSNRREQDRRLEKFVRFAEYYIEVYYIPALVMMLLEHVKNFNVNVLNIIDGLGPLFYYIDGEEDKEDDDDGEEYEDYEGDDSADGEEDFDAEKVGEEEIRKEVEQYITSLIDKKNGESKSVVGESGVVDRESESVSEKDEDSPAFSDFKLFTLCRIFLLSVENKWL